jgi:hypothetical protein
MLWRGQEGLEDIMERPRGSPRHSLQSLDGHQDAIGKSS